MVSVAPLTATRSFFLKCAFALPITRKYGATVYAAHVVPEPIGLPVSAREGLQAIGVQQQPKLGFSCVCT